MPRGGGASGALSAAAGAAQQSPQMPRGETPKEYKSASPPLDGTHKLTTVHSPLAERDLIISKIMAAKIVSDCCIGGDKNRSFVT